MDGTADLESHNFVKSHLAKFASSKFKQKADGKTYDCTLCDLTLTEENI